MFTIERQIQQCLKKLQRWTDENGFKFSPTKTQCVHFCKLKKPHNDPVLKIGDIEIPVVKEAKFLGVIFDKKLSFVPHIKQLKTKCQKALNLLKHLAHTDWGADRKVLLNLYRSLIRSKLDYGSIVYGSARKSYLKWLDPVHHQGLRLAFSAFRTSPAESLLAEANEPSLYHRREKLTMNYALKLKSNPNNPANNAVFNNQYAALYNRKPNITISISLRLDEVIKETDINFETVSEDKPHLIPPRI